MNLKIYFILFMYFFGPYFGFTVFFLEFNGKFIHWKLALQYYKFEERNLPASLSQIAYKTVD